MSTSEPRPPAIFYFDVISPWACLMEHALRQAPLSGVDEKPMKRASLVQLRQLLLEDEITGYEAGVR